MIKVFNIVLPLASTNAKKKKIVLWDRKFESIRNLNTVQTLER